MKTPEQWLEELRLYDNWISDTTALRLIQAIQKDAVESTNQRWQDELKQWTAQMRSVLATPVHDVSRSQPSTKDP